MFPIVWLVITTDRIGGSEKRFTNFWEYTNKIKCYGYEVKLVLNNSLYGELCKINFIDPNCKILSESIVIEHFDTSSIFKQLSIIQKFITTKTNKGDIIHFIGDTCLLPLKRRIVYTITQSSLNNVNIYGKLVLLYGCLLANRVDVLDPSIFRFIRKLLFWKSNTVFLTTNSCCNIQQFYPKPANEKKNWIVFLGRFENVKQIIPYVQSIPFIFKRLSALNLSDLKFLLLGNGALESEIRKMVATPIFKDIPIVIHFEKHPEKILASSKVFLSLQMHNNYPSRSLIEGLATGNLPVVTDNGETRWIAKEEFSFYVNEKFTPEELSVQIENVFKLSGEQFQKKSELARSFVINEHTIEKMADYYENIYKSF